MKITRIDVTPLSVPVEKSFVGSVQFREFNPIVVEVFTDEGLSAHGLTMVFNSLNVKPLKACVEAVAETVIGLDVFNWAQTWDTAWKMVGSRGKPMSSLCSRPPGSRA